MNRRPLAAMVSELATSVRPDPASGSALRVTRIAFDLPVEVALGREGPDLVLNADLPRWRWRSDFDRVLGRMTLDLEAVAS